LASKTVFAAAFALGPYPKDFLMAGTRIIEDQGKRILHIDIAQCDLEGVKKVVEDAKVIVAKQPEQSLLTLTNVAGTQLNSLVTRTLKDFAVHNKPFVRAGAVIGLDSLRRIEFNAVVRFSGRKLHAFDDFEKAKAWLLEQ
jgi:hypothetical protein